MSDPAATSSAVENGNASNPHLPSGSGSDGEHDGAAGRQPLADETGVGIEADRGSVHGTDDGDDDASRDGDAQRSGEDNDSNANTATSHRDTEDAGEEGDVAATGIAANDVKNIILQVLSPYFDDEGGTGDAGGGGGEDIMVTPTTSSPNSALAGGGRGLPDNNDNAGEEGRGSEAAGTHNRNGSGNNKVPPLIGEEDDTAQRYDHVKAKSWIQLICDGITERLVAMGKPYKFVTHLMVMRKCGAGMHICSSNYYSQADGWLSHAHDLSPHIYAVVTVYWMAV